MKIKIVGTGSAVPNKKVSNSYLSEYIETDDQWIRERTGIRNRHLADKSKGETASSLAVQAGKLAMESSGLAKEDIDVVIVASTSSKDLLPSTACVVQKELELENAFAFDVSAACTGFIVGLTTAMGYFEMGIAKKALVIGTECLSNIMNWNDRGSCILFGDGAGAAVVEAVPGNGYLPIIHSNGKLGDALICENEYSIQDLFLDMIKADNDNSIEEKSDSEALKETGTIGDQSEMDDVLLRNKVSMDGKAVFQFAVRKVPEIIQEVLNANHINIEEIDSFVLHQANQRIIESIAKRLKQPENKFPINVDKYGNTSSASIPILLDELFRSNGLKAGEKICMAGFGAGLTWGAFILEI